MASRLLAAAGALQHRQTCSGGGAAAKGSGELLVYVRTDSGTVPVTVDAGGTVGCLTEAVAAAMDTNSRQIALLLKGERLDSGGRDVLLADCGVSQEVCLTLQVHAPFKCIAHHEQLSVTAIEGSPSPAYTVLLMDVHSNALAFFDPPLSTDGDAAWHIEVNDRVRGGCYLLGLTARGHTDVGTGNWETLDTMIGDSSTWCFEDNGHGHCAGTEFEGVSYRGPSSVSLLLSGGRLRMTVRGRRGVAGGRDWEESSMELTSGVTVRFFACLYNAGAAMDIGMEAA
eukprot:TRINITY_DN615_c0_g1_i16.p1 TRINITY_DN615_c0_g1~~TRINITY_DN615_c0_g1_i16.p1  ORF type:complete len:315 (+),score=66.53 TRINITY_DN615_c0_g1_i16:94-945(+)